MTRLMGTTLLALTLGLGSPTLAQDSQLQQQTGTFLAQHGYGDVDASRLSEEQLARLIALGERDVSSEAILRQRIDEILVMEADTSLYVSDEMQAMFDDPEYPELRQNARQLLSEAGYETGVVEALSVEQLAQMWFLQGRDEVRNDPSELENRIQTILDAS